MCLASFGPNLIITILAVRCMWSLLVVEGSRWWMTVVLTLMPVYMFVVVVYITILVNLVNWRRRKKHNCICISGPSSCPVLSLFWTMLINAIVMECWGCCCHIWTRDGDVLMIVVVQVVVVLYPPPSPSSSSSSNDSSFFLQPVLPLSSSMADNKTATSSHPVVTRPPQLSNGEIGPKAVKDFKNHCLNYFVNAKVVSRIHSLAS